MRFKIKNSKLYSRLIGKAPDFPKYTTQILNLANANSQATRPTVVGQLSEEIRKPGNTDILAWEKNYKQAYPTALKVAADKVERMVAELKKSIGLIDRAMIETWIEDLVINKTYVGFQFQDAILHEIAVLRDTSYVRASAAQEAQGIDRFVDSIPISVKPHTYKKQAQLPEQIEATIAYYEKKKDGLLVEIEGL